MQNLNFTEITRQKRDFLPLLLLADDGEHLENYLESGSLFLLSNREKTPIAVALVAYKQAGIYEIENFAVSTHFQKSGYGRKMMQFLLEYYQEKIKATEIVLGTDDVSGNVQFYEKCGFTITHKIPNYFIEHYENPIFEGKSQLKDKIYLRRKLR